MTSTVIIYLFFINLKLAREPRQVVRNNRKAEDRKVRNTSDILKEQGKLNRKRKHPHRVKLHSIIVSCIMGSPSSWDIQKNISDDRSDQCVESLLWNKWMKRQEVWKLAWNRYRYPCSPRNEVNRGQSVNEINRHACT